MSLVPAPLVAAALHSGRFDPWPSLNALGGLEPLLRASSEERLAAGLPEDLVRSMARQEPMETSLSWVAAGQDRYPASLGGLPFAPPVLFYQGDLSVLEAPLVSIVGSRRCTASGRRVAASVAAAVCLAGGVVVSGLATGIDSAAHDGAMDHGLTVGIPGMGLLAVDRPGAERLRRRIVEGGGLILSEFLPRFPPRAFTFLQRNRVIGGLSRATVVVEAAHRSGALSTARHALAAGREVLAVPGSMDSPTAQGCLDLLERGATMVRSPASVLSAVGLDGAPTQVSLPGMSGVRRLVADALQGGGTLDQLAARAGLSALEAARLITDLELAGLVRREPGQRYVLVGPSAVER